MGLFLSRHGLAHRSRRCPFQKKKKKIAPPWTKTEHPFWYLRLQETFFDWQGVGKESTNRLYAQNTDHSAVQVNTSVDRIVDWTCIHRWVRHLLSITGEVYKAIKSPQLNQRTSQFTTGSNWGWLVERKKNESFLAIFEILCLVLMEPS